MNSIKGNNNMMMKAMSAMMSGQNPRQFLSDLAKTDPRLKGMDFNNLQQTTQNLCNQSGINMNDALNQIKSCISKFH